MRKHQMAYPLLQQAGQGYLLQILGSTPTLSSLSSQTATTTASELSYQSPLCSSTVGAAVDF